MGTARAGFKHDIVVECNPDAVATLNANKAKGVAHAKDWRVFADRVEKFDYSTIASGLDLLSAGPPCQPFSLGGKHKGHEDDRNMFPHVVNAVRVLKPRAFMIENVKGLLRKAFAPYYSYIIYQLRYPDHGRKAGEDWEAHLRRLVKYHETNPTPSDAWYDVKFKLLNSADFGVPQRRERVIIVGIRSDLGVSFEYPTQTHSADALIYSKWVSGEYWEIVGVAKKDRPKPTKSEKARADRLAKMVKAGTFDPKKVKPWVTVRQALKGLPVLKVGGTDPKDKNHFLNPGARSYAGHTGSPPDLPAKTLKAGDHGVPGGENTLQLEGGKARYFSVREAARLQTFPDSYVFDGAWTEGMRQLGNAVPVTLAEVVAKKLAATLT